MNIMSHDLDITFKFIYGEKRSNQAFFFHQQLNILLINALPKRQLQFGLETLTVLANQLLYKR